MMSLLWALLALKKLAIHARLTIGFIAATLLYYKGLTLLAPFILKTVGSTIVKPFNNKCSPIYMLDWYLDHKPTPDKTSMVSEPIKGLCDIERYWMSSARLDYFQSVMASIQSSYFIGAISISVALLTIIATRPTYNIQLRLIDDVDLEISMNEYAKFTAIALTIFSSIANTSIATSVTAFLANVIVSSFLMISTPILLKLNQWYPLSLSINAALRTSRRYETAISEIAYLTVRALNYKKTHNLEQTVFTYCAAVYSLTNIIFSFVFLKTNAEACFTKTELYGYFAKINAEQLRSTITDALFQQIIHLCLAADSLKNKKLILVGTLNLVYNCPEHIKKPIVSSLNKKLSKSDVFKGSNMRELYEDISNQLIAR